MRIFFTFCVFLFFVLPVAAADEPDVFGALSGLDNAISSAAEEFSLSDGYYIGRAVAAHILEQYPLYTKDSELINYLNLICSALAINSRSPYWFNGYHVMILDSNIPNAYSTPGGHIFVSRGLIDIAASEDMLASVIAHEIAHIQLSHGLAEIKHERLVTGLNREQEKIARMTENELAAERYSAFAEPVSNIVNILFSRGYSQLQEFEADSMALDLLVSTGYHPSCLAETLRLFDKIKADFDSGLSSSHPLPIQRISDAEKKAASYRAKDTRSARNGRFIRIIKRDLR